MILLYLAALWALCAAAGYGTAGFLLPRGWRHERPVLAPSIGAAILIVLAATASYAGLAMATAAPLIALGALALSTAGGFLSRRRPVAPVHSWRLLAALHSLGLAAALSALLSALLYNAWNPYNDAFTYVSIADHLQLHSYFEPAVPTATEPLLTQMWLYQALGFRMGSTFLLAFATALFRATYAFDLYLPVLALAVWLAVPGFWVLCRRGLFLSPRSSTLAAAFYGLHTGIPITNAIWGFQPQAWGYAMVFPYLALHVRASSRDDRVRRLLAAGLFGGTLLLAYTELVPFAVAAVGTCYAVRLLRGRLKLSSAVVAGVGPLVASALVAPVAAVRFVPALRVQASVVVGWDPGFSLFDYFALLSGYRSFAQSVVDAPGTAGLIVRLATVAATCTAAYAAFTLKRGIARQLMLVGIVFVLAVGWFSLGASNPWQAGAVGQPWSTYKAVTYAFFLFAALWGCGLSALWNKGGLSRLFAAGQFVAFLVFFVVASLQTADVVSREIRGATGNESDPIAEYKRVPELLAGQPDGQAVNLQIPDAAWRHRQMVAYFLRRPVVADWSNDPYIGAYLPGGGKLRSDPRLPSLIFGPPSPGQSIARLELVADATLLVDATLGEGWHAREADGRDWWRWAGQQGSMEILVQRAGWITLSADLAIVGAPRRRVTMTLSEQPDRTTSYDVPAQWFTPFSTDRVRVEPGTYHVILSVDGPTTPMSSSDTRLIAFGVRNLTWTLTPE